MYWHECAPPYNLDWSLDPNKLKKYYIINFVGLGQLVKPICYFGPTIIGDVKFMWWQTCSGYWRNRDDMLLFRKSNHWVQLLPWASLEDWHYNTGYWNKSHRLTRLTISITSRPWGITNSHNIDFERGNALNWSYYVSTTMRFYEAEPVWCSFSFETFSFWGSRFPSSTRK